MSCSFQSSIVIRSSQCPKVAPSPSIIRCISGGTDKVDLRSRHVLSETVMGQSRTTLGTLQVFQQT